MGIINHIPISLRTRSISPKQPVDQPIQPAKDNGDQPDELVAKWNEEHADAPVSVIE